MSEAPFMFLLLVAVRHLLRWWRSGTTTSLVITGVALGLAYLTRYEAIAAAAGALAVVALRTYQRRSSVPEERWRWVAAETLVAGLPFVFTFAGWALASWIITGNPFETFTSIYGNSSQVALAGTSIADTTGHGIDALLFAIREILALSPALPVLVAIAGGVAVWRRQADVIVPLAVLGGVLGFGVLTTVTGSSFAWLRFSINAIPLGVVLAFVALSHPTSAMPAAVVPAAVVPAAGDFVAAVPPPAVAHSSGREAALTVLIVLLVAASVPIGLASMTNPRLGREEADQLSAIAGGRDPSLASVQQAQIGGEAAAYLDGLGLPDGSVIVDVAVGFQIVLQSNDPRQFVITPDRDFERALADPKTFSVSFMLVPSGTGYSSLDAVGRAYPALYQDGGGFASLVRQFGSGIFAWRLYAIT
jgi:hypothetical protein